MKILGLAAVVMVVSGCGGHYVMDSHIDPGQIAGVDSPDAIKVYVGQCSFNDGAGLSFALNYSSAEGEISPWIKKSIVDVIGNIKFVDDPKDADIVIATKKVEFSVAAWGVRTIITSDINKNEMKAISYSHSNMNIAPANAKNYRDRLTVASHMLATALKKAIVIHDNKIILTDIPQAIEGHFYKNDDNPEYKVYKIEIKDRDKNKDKE